MEVRRIPMEQLGPLLEEQLQYGSARLPVTGSSMLPTLRQGRDVVRLVPVKYPPEKGAILLYRRENRQYVLHRLIRMENSELCLCCGDNQWERELVPFAQVIAVVDGLWRGGRWVDLKTDRKFLWNQRLWTNLYSVRRPMIAARRVIGRLRRIIKHHGGKLYED